MTENILALLLKIFQSLKFRSYELSINQSNEKQKETDCSDALCPVEKWTENDRLQFIYIHLKGFV